MDNIWVQPIDGSPGRQITHFKSEQILSFHWSPDGKILAYCAATLILMWYSCKNPNRKTRDQHFFALWKDADPDIPILKEAKAEYEKLK